MRSYPVIRPRSSKLPEEVNPDRSAHFDRIQGIEPGWHAETCVGDHHVGRSQTASISATADRNSDRSETSATAATACPPAQRSPWPPRSTLRGGERSDQRDNRAIPGALPEPPDPTRCAGDDHHPHPASPHPTQSPPLPASPEHPCHSRISRLDDTWFRIPVPFAR